MTAELTELDRATATRRSDPHASPQAPRSGVSPARRLVEVGVRVVIAAVVWFFLADVFWGDVVHYASVTLPVSLHHLPYRDFLWEFPPLSLVPAIGSHVAGPAYTLVFTATMIALEYGSLEVLRRAFPQRAGAVARWWHVAVLPLAAFTWFRLDFLSVIFATAGLVALVKVRPAGRWAVLGFAAKLWPAVLVVGLVVQRRLRSAWLAVAGCAAVVALWWAWAPHGLGTFLEYRKGGGIQVESTIGAVRLLLGAHPSVVSGAWVVGDGGWAWVDPAGMALVATAVVAIVLWSRRRVLDPVRVCGFLTVMLLVTSRILSPQYLVWVAPFAVLLAADGDRRVGILFTASAWLTFAVLVDYDAFLLGNRALALLAVARNVVLVVLGASMLVGVRVRSGRAAPGEAGSGPVDLAEAGL